MKIGSGKKKIGFGLAMIAVGISLLIVVSHESAPFEPGHSNQKSGVTYHSIPRIESGAEVIEFFWYGCTHCKLLEQSLINQDFHHQVSELVRSDGSRARFQRVPAVLNPMWTLHARLYFALDALGMSEVGHFNTMKWIGQEMPKNQAQIIDLLHREILPQEMSINPSFLATAHDVSDLMYSAKVDSQISIAKQLGKAAGLSGVPTFVVDGSKVLPLGHGLDYQSLGPAVLSLLSNPVDETIQ